MSKEKIIKVYVSLLEEGTDTIRETEAIDLGGGLVKLKPTPWYDSDDEIWEFLPGTIVKTKMAKDFHDRDVLLAYEKASP
ncbi:MAG: hypothetical protein H6868_04750 [Rhodospirillales bacterium]|nr:hypothetical protein [Rhodospirillales bacterium]